MNSIKIAEVVDCLVGDVYPYGDSNVDRDRKENLLTLFQVIRRLLGTVSDVSISKNRQESSMKEIGELAEKFLKKEIQGYEH